MPQGAEEIKRVVTVFRELRQGVTEDGRAKVKSPSGTLSTAEAISVVTSGLALAAHFGDGVLRPADVAGGITGAVVQDPVSDRAVWRGEPEGGVQGPGHSGGLFPTSAPAPRVTHPMIIPSACLSS